MTPREFLKDLKRYCPEYAPEDTVDVVIAGDPDRPIQRAMTTWICGRRAIEEAIARGADMIISHEPTFYSHSHELDWLGGRAEGDVYGVAGREKLRLLERHGITVVRVHDMWDYKAGIGIRDSWARYLGLPGEPIASFGFERCYSTEPRTLRDFARHVAERCAKLGDGWVQMIGDGDKIVSSVSLGAGYDSSVQGGVEMGADVTILCDDSNVFWRGLQCARDLGHALLRVNHGISEEPGMRALCAFIQSVYPELDASHCDLRPLYQYIGAEA